MGVVLTITIGIIFDKTNASSGDPGTVSDPLVTKSYVDKLNAELKQEVLSMTGTGGTSTVQPTNMTEIYEYIDNKFASISSSGGSESGAGFVVVEVAAGKKIIGNASTEMILRSGKAEVLANQSGEGLSDVTSGNDIKGGIEVELNHLLIVPRSDNRGLSVIKKSYIMVKGGYSLQ
jgi:hypothetical protein